MIGLVENSRIRTTYPRAKEASRFADKMITIAKRGTLHARRELISKLSSPPTAKRLVEEIAPLFKDQQGGYTRVLRHKFRPGDGAELALLEFTRVIEKPVAEGEKKKKKEKKKKEKPEGKVEAPGEKPAKKKEPKAAQKEEPSKGLEEPKKGKVEGEKGGAPQKEEPKKGGFLSNLRKFLTGN